MPHGARLPLTLPRWPPFLPMQIEAEHETVQSVLASRLVKVRAARTLCRSGSGIDDVISHTIRCVCPTPHNAHAMSR